MVQLEQYEPTALPTTEADPNMEVNITKHNLMTCVFLFLNRVVAKVVIENIIFFSSLCRIKSLRCTHQLGGNLSRATLKQLNSSVTVLTGKDSSLIIFYTTAAF